MAPTPVRGTGKKPKPLKVKLFPEQKRVSFKPPRPLRPQDDEEDSDDDYEAFVTTPAPRTSLIKKKLPGKLTPSSSSTTKVTPVPRASLTKKKHPDTPYPSSSATTTTASASSTQESKVKVTKTPTAPEKRQSSRQPPPKRSAGSQPEPSTSAGKRQKKAKADTPVGKRRRTKRQQLVLFPTVGNAKSRPSNSLTAQLTYVLEILPAKMDALKKSSKMCHAIRCVEMEKMEDDLMKRLGVVSSLKIDRDDRDLENKKFQVIDEMQDMIGELQEELENMETKMNQNRQTLRASYGHFVCCKVCAKNEDN